MKHIEWIDDMKGVGIFLIVLGHAIATINAYSTGDVHHGLSGMFRYIYSFHVPFFFVLAGVTFSARDDFVRFVGKKFFRLMVPYFVFGICCGLLYGILGNKITADIGAESFTKKALVGEWWVPIVAILHGGGWPDGKGFSFNGVLWFLPVLFVCELLYYPMARFFRRCRYVAIGILPVIVILLFFYGRIFQIRAPYGLTWAIVYLPFLALGHSIGQTIIRGGESRRELFWWGGVNGMILCLGLIFLSRYSKVVIFALATIVPLMLVAPLRVFRCFAWFAPHTMAIMLTHKLLLVVMQIGVAKSGIVGVKPILIAPALVCITTLFCMLICSALSSVLITYLPWSVGVSRQNRTVRT